MVEIIRPSTILRELIKAGVPEHVAESMMNRDIRATGDEEKYVVSVPVVEMTERFTVTTKLVNLVYERDPNDLERWVPSYVVHAEG